MDLTSQSLIILNYFAAVLVGVLRITRALVQVTCPTIERVTTVPVSGIQCVNAGTAVQTVRITAEGPGTDGVVTTAAVDVVVTKVLLAFVEYVAFVRYP